MVSFLGAIFFTVTTAALLTGCASFRLNPDREVAPSEKVDRAWAPPLSITNADNAVSNLQQLLRLDENNTLSGQIAQPYDLPALIDLALRTSPQTRQAWYAALAANAELGRSQAANYPQVEADAPSSYFKLPIQFPGQTLVVRNEAFLPQVKVGYDLLDFGRTRALERSAREQLIAANFSFDRAIQDVVFNVEKGCRRSRRHPDSNRLSLRNNCSSTAVRIGTRSAAKRP
jgi:outer membrane protein TolC